MKVTCIMPITKTSLRSPRNRAVMSIRRDEHTVVNLITGERIILPMEEAWELHKRLNIYV